MPNGLQEVTVSLPIYNVWDVVKDINNWATLVPGYISHELYNDRQSKWEFISDIGIFKKKIVLHVDITEWNEPNSVVFKLTGVNEKITGNGYFKAEKVSTKKTKIIGFMEINSYGMLAKIVNVVIIPIVPTITSELTKGIANKVTEMNVEIKHK